MKFLSGQFSRLLDSIKNLISYDSASIGLSKKRECESHRCFDDSDDDIEFEPPPKRSRLVTYSNTDSIKRTGLPISRHSLDYLIYKKNIKEKENSVAAGMNVITESVMGNKEKFKKTTLDYNSKESEEAKCLGSIVKIPRSTFYNIDSTFKFSPSVVTSEFCPTITSTVGREMSTNLKGKQSEDFNKSKEILDLKRTPLKAKRSSLLGKYVNPTRLCFSNLKTTMQSFRLSEKKEYGKLLEQYTSSNFQHFNRPISSLQGTNGIKTALSISHLDPKYTLEKKKSFKNEKQNRTKFTNEVSSNNESLRGSSYEIPVIDLEKEEDRLRNSSDDEIFVTKHIKPQKCQPINSLEEKLLKCEYYRGEDLQNFKAEDLEKKIFYQESIKKIEEKSERRIKFINNLHNVDRLSSCLSKLTTKYPVEYIEISEEDELPELTREIKIVINHAFKGGSPSQVLAEKFNIQITRKDICTLAGLNWLNDEIINFYMNMIVDRSQKDKGYPKVYAFNTFFYSKLISTGYGSVKRWTKKVDIFTHDLLIIPVHLGMHWCLAIIDFRTKSIRYYDSMLGNNYKCLEELRNYLENEHKDKKKYPYGTILRIENVKDIPQQMNGSDCGMFACKFAEYLSRNSSITFTQENMPYFRNRMVFEIFSQKLMTEPLKPYK